MFVVTKWAHATDVSVLLTVRFFPGRGRGNSFFVLSSILLNQCSGYGNIGCGKPRFWPCVLSGTTFNFFTKQRKQILKCILLSFSLCLLIRWCNTSFPPFWEYESRPNNELSKGACFILITLTSLRVKSFMQTEFWKSIFKNGEYMGQVAQSRPTETKRQR